MEYNGGKHIPKHNYKMTTIETIKEKKKEIGVGAITASLIATLFIFTLAGYSGEVKMHGTEGDIISCPNGECNFPTTIRNDLEETIRIDLITLKASGNPFILKSEGGLKEKVIQEIETISYKDAKFECEDTITSEIDKNGSECFKCVDNSKEVGKTTFDKEYTTYDPNRKEFSYVEKEIEVTNKTTTILNQGLIELEAGKSIDLDLSFSVPINSDGKFSVEVDIILANGTRKHLVLDPYYNSTAFPYYQEIIIIPTGTVGNYSQKILLNSSNVGTSWNWSSDGDGVLFTNTTNDPLGFWIEEWNSTANTSTIWVKISQMTFGTNVTIIMHYGNSSAGTLNNITEPFLLGCDFDWDNCSLIVPSYSSMTAYNHLIWDDTNGWLEYYYKRDPAGNTPGYPAWIDFPDFTSSSWEMLWENGVLAYSWGGYGSSSGLGVINGHPSNSAYGGTETNLGDYHRANTHSDTRNSRGPKNWYLSSEDHTGTQYAFVIADYWITELSETDPMDVRYYYNGSEDNLSVVQGATDETRNGSLSWDNDTFTYWLFQVGTGSTSSTSPYEKGWIDTLIIRNYLPTSPTYVIGSEKNHITLNITVISSQNFSTYSESQTFNASTNYATNCTLNIGSTGYLSTTDALTHEWTEDIIIGNNTIYYNCSDGTESINSTSYWVYYDYNISISNDVNETVTDESFAFIVDSTVNANCTLQFNSTAYNNFTSMTSYTWDTNLGIGNNTGVYFNCTAGTVAKTTSTFWIYYYIPLNVSITLLGYQTFIDWRPDTGGGAQLIQPYLQNTTEDSCILQLVNNDGNTSLYIKTDTLGENATLLCGWGSNISNALTLNLSYQLLNVSFLTTGQVCCWANLTAPSKVTQIGNIDIGDST